MRKDIKIILLLFILCSLALFTYEANQIEQKIDTVITIPQGNFDIGNKQQGTITISMDSGQYNKLLLDNADKNVKYFIFFSSKVLPGLEIRYNLEEQVFEAGIPTFKSQKVDLFNNQHHMLAFTYQLGDKQVLYFDGQNIGHRPYLNMQGNLISGFIIKQLGTLNKIESSILAYKINITDQVVVPKERNS